MDQTLPELPFINGRLSFAPLVDAWKKNAAAGSPGARRVYQYLLERIHHHPELLSPIDDFSILEEHQEWVDILMTTLFPVSTSDEKDIYAVSVPFNFKFIHTSKAFREYFLDSEGQLKYQPEREAKLKLIDEKCSVAYKMILSKYYGRVITGHVTTILQLPHPETGLPHYFEMELDPTFIQAVPKGELPPLLDDFKCGNMNDLRRMEKLQECLPLDKFVFEGIAIIRIKDVTRREVVNNIKNILLEQHNLEDNSVFADLENEMRTLIGIPGLKLGLTPFLNINNHFVFSEQQYQNTVLLRSMQDKPVKAEVFRVFQEMFQALDEPLLLENIDAAAVEKQPMLGMLTEKGYHSAAFFPLKSEGKLVGVLSAAHAEAGTLNGRHLHEVMPSIPLFVLALEKAAERLDVEVDKVIKKHFTAVQASVEWKFTEAALQYLANKKQGIKAKIETISFDQVFPLYGAIDVRNSSIERNNAIQLDLKEQLEGAGKIVRQAEALTNMPLLKEISFRIEKYQYNVSNILFSGDEILIDNFLKNELVELLQHLRTMVPALQPVIDQYFEAIDPKVKLRVEHRHDFEDSITMINQELARFIDQEQEAAQKIYPHYFERFVTDGVDFNMYIGQSISPDRPFDTFYLKNLKMWQLNTLANAAIMVKQLKDKLSMPLETTQLILAHSLPISISFRTAERKFDVEGAYNIRYEIIKKRIDKVHVRNSNERLTQPGKIAIVYTQAREATEYISYVEYLQNQGVLLHDIEHLELEELQGVIGLKALRVGINMEYGKSSELESERNTRKATVL
ncbi:GAF domain-containing protein [Flavihumibacter petaseus]|uniref:GAF domain-containing protein n=1 Tax=Flavihumibacter petaseus NBRC 106054 TaxID=1220578 RepID=A0A0E9MZE8_9BACT|nr:GAF domain-containing protein [Flavihumibacter petaseus]GAO42883.1 hypothetical protein FPE01S_01_19010 [Flavihumibacter petaseus NBRC 106054]